MRSLRSKTDPAKACSTWLGCKIKALALLRVQQSLTTYLHHEVPSLTCRRSLIVFFIVSSHTKKDSRALPQKQTTDRQSLCELLALSSGGRSGAGLPLALGLLCTAYPLFQFHTTLPSSLLSLYYHLHAFYSKPSWGDLCTHQQRNTQEFSVSCCFFPISDFIPLQS